MNHPTTASLTIVGTGIQLINDLSHAARTWITESDTLLFHVADDLSAQWLQQLNPAARPLLPEAVTGRRAEAHQHMVGRIMAALHNGEQVCVVFYGHPGVFTDPAHRAVKAAQAAGYPARILPAISSMAWLFADCGIDPAKGGLQSYEATAFLRDEKPIDPGAHLILWQIAFIDNLEGEPTTSAQGLLRLQNRLLQVYPPDHSLTLYLAAVYPTQQAQCTPCRTGDLAAVKPHPATTLYVPPLPDARP
ncbi:SAM-dependent methyltransferase [Acanthopleuribacter pedis]|uniref:Tetrapyrrole methylase domain-containing protein n=1 Tax=Acanthopleuribacter pedis TaxID=442870 RepID=A0A8J7Q3Y4_9BACT|nr:SAM-dependent methyltransferase [Acanthopleuribacter pedis]MBO1317622.1 hypothetical protein [Acanthopleuribacter pedis]